MGLRKRAGIGPQLLAGRWVVKERADFVDQLLYIKEINQPSGLVVRNRFAQRLGVARHNRAARAHRFQQAPGEHEGIREVHVHGGQLQQRDEMLKPLLNQ